MDESSGTLETEDLRVMFTRRGKTLQREAGSRLGEKEGEETSYKKGDRLGGKT